MYFPKLCNQVRSLDHFVFQNSGDFLWGLVYLALGLSYVRVLLDNGVILFIIIKECPQELTYFSTKIHLLCPREVCHPIRMLTLWTDFGVCPMWSVLQQRWWHGKLQRNPKVLATAVISLQIDLIFCAPTGINFFPFDIIFLQNW